MQNISAQIKVSEKHFRSDYGKSEGWKEMT